MFAHPTLTSTTPPAASRQGTIPLSTGKTVILSGLLNGKWIENEYQLNDQDWRDALKLFRDIGTSVRMRYK
jgi:hypothetical protein